LNFKNERGFERFYIKAMQYGLYGKQMHDAYEMLKKAYAKMGLTP